jgi:hypothetical protein
MKHGKGVNTAQFSPTDERLLTASDDNTARLWDIPTVKMEDSEDDLRLLANLAEAVGGFTLQTSGDGEIGESLTFEQIHDKREKIATGLLTSFSNLTPLQRFMRWSVSEWRRRTVSPFCELTIAEWIQNNIDNGTLSDLRGAIFVEPANARLAAYFGRRLAERALQETDPTDARRKRVEADFQTRRALKIAPDNDEIRKLRVEVVKLLQLSTE